jgi:hypothetical protein
MVKRSIRKKASNEQPRQQRKQKVLCGDFLVLISEEQYRPHNEKDGIKSHHFRIGA